LDSPSAITNISGHFSYTLLAVTPQGTTFLVIVLLALLLLSFVVSGAEVALFSLTNKDVNMLKTKQHTAAKRITDLLAEPKEVYTSLLIAGTFMNICIIILANYLFNQYFPYGKIKLVNGGFDFIIELVLRVVAIAFIVVFLERSCQRFGQRKTIYGSPTALPLSLRPFTCFFGGSVVGWFLWLMAWGNGSALTGFRHREYRNWGNLTI